MNQEDSEQNETERMKKGAVTHVKCRFVDFCFQKSSVMQQQYAVVEILWRVQCISLFYVLCCVACVTSMCEAVLANEANEPQLDY